MSPIYLDHNATTPVHPDVVEQMRVCLTEQFGNPSSLHSFGQEARTALEHARRDVATSLGALPDEVMFSSGGTEANNHALLMAARARSGHGKHIVTTAIEHQAVLGPCYALEQAGYEVSYVPVRSDGVVDPAQVAAAFRPGTTLCSVMLANNDVGTIQPVRDIAALARPLGILVHSDAAQALGKIPVNVRELDVDLLSVSAHKIRGPKGVGALYVRRGTLLPALLHGGPQERGLRAGTEALPAIAGFGKACALAREGLDERNDALRELRDRLERGLLGLGPQVSAPAASAPRLSNTLHVSFAGFDAEQLLYGLDELGIAVSTGAACSASSGKPSHVLVAMGLPSDQARGALRFSLGDGNDVGQIDATIDAVRSLLATSRRSR